MTTTELNATGYQAFVIEDDPDTRANLSDILELDGFDVSAAGSAHEALAFQHWQQISVVILDRKLPDANALELLPRIKQLAPAAAVVVVTGYADLDGAISALRDGATEYILKPINPDALRASLAQIVDRLRTAEALRESQRHLQEQRDFAQNVLNTAQIIILVLDTQGRIAQFNPYLEEICGYSPAEVQGNDWFSVFVPEPERDSIRNTFQHVLAEGNIQGYVSSILTKAGTQRDIHWNAQVLKDRHQYATGVLATGQDITDLKQAQVRALQNERLAAIGETMAGLMHESRNALQRCRACLEMLALEIADRPKALNLVERTQIAQNDLHQLFEEVRDYAAPINLDRRLCNLAEVWRQAWREVSTLNKDKHLHLNEAVDGIPRECRLDAFRLRQVFRNVFENAVQASSDGDQISISCKPIKLTGKDAVRISIRDHGPGIPVELRARILEPFFTTKAKGTGLGLAIAQRIVQLHGGWIHVGLDQQPGTEILIDLPRGVK